MKNKIGLVTSFQEYNYGAMLQAFALRYVINQSGDCCEIIWLDGGLVKFKDIRLKKIFMMFVKMITHPTVAKKTINTYKNAYSREMSEASKKRFIDFSDEYFNIVLNSYSNWKRIAATNKYKGFVCGSDQIWNSTAIYVEPMYYLQFAPIKKRIAYAPSLGKNFIPKYNEKIMKRYISSIPSISVREEQGARLIYELTGKNVRVALDPSFLISKSEWIDIFDLKKKENDYILCYFLNEPTVQVYKKIVDIQKQTKSKIVFIPYLEEWHSKFNDYTYIDAGPIEFLDLVYNAKIVITDSFHGTAFSINFNRDFYVVKRQYGNNDSQESRITNLLSRYNLINRYSNGDDLNLLNPIDWEYVNKKLDEQVSNSKKYLYDSIERLL